jgi:hypothetical protein
MNVLTAKCTNAHTNPSDTMHQLTCASACMVLFPCGFPISIPYTVFHIYVYMSRAYIYIYIYIYIFGLILVSGAYIAVVI